MDQQVPAQADRVELTGQVELAIAKAEILDLPRQVVLRNPSREVDDDAAGGGHILLGTGHIGHLGQGAGPTQVSVELTNRGAVPNESVDLDGAVEIAFLQPFG